MPYTVITQKDVFNLWINRDQKYFFDTNIVLYLQAPYANPRSWETKVYSKLMGRILRFNGIIVINSVVIGEYMQNCVKRLHREMVRDSGVSENYKQFRTTPAFAERADQAGKSILGFCRSAKLMDMAIEHGDLERYCQNFCSGNIDFPDLMILETCRRHSCTLVTHDRDYHFADVELITANPHFRD